MTDAATIPHRFRAQAARTPSAPAITDGGCTLDYATLDRWSDRVHDDLVHAGARRGDLIGLSVRGGAPVVAGILGILKTGCGYVPLDPFYPVARLVSISVDSGVRLIVGDDATPVGLTTAATVVELPGPRERRLVYAPVLGSGVGPDDVAYVIYTSGSTGVPKGVPIRHRNVLSLFDAAASWFDFRAADVWTLFHSYSFDFSVWEMWGALLHGGRLLCVPALLRIDGAGFAAMLAEEQVTILNIVPSVFRHLLAGRAVPAGALRRVVFGGEALDATSVADWLVRQDPRHRPEVVNMYGITETTVHVTYRRVIEADLCRDEPGTLIGRPLAHLGIRLLGPDGSPVPAGEPGEIVVSGAGVAAGYLGRPGLTDQRFPRNRDGRCFHSGDIAHWSERDDSYVFHGRLDDQVQFRGFRVELGEIEHALRACPGVRDAAVVVEQHALGHPVLSAYVTAPEFGRAGLAAVRDRLRATLPAHMVPGRIQMIDQLPRTASGKVDRRALVDTADRRSPGRPRS
ncbi:amino acid adenylation domain-containing protein [Streptomyces nojiriensis]|uniref:amino acid adenylation domain-containing protein n=1 Tax=Streptomyces nojiriensis TaxID=66374 RepID=UPI0036479540